MRPNHQRRQRGRNGKPNKFPNRNQSYDSNGPDVRVRGTAHQIFEKYQALAREAMTSGDRVMAEAYYQHAEHYFRIIQAQGGFVQPRFPQPWEESEGGEDGAMPGGDGQPGDGAVASGPGGVDPTEVPQPSVEFPQRNPGYAQGEDYPPSREGGFNGEERYRGREDGRGGYEPRRQERREDEGGYGPRGRRDFVTRAEQRYQDRQERYDRPQAGDGQPPAADAGAGAMEAPAEPQEAPAPDAGGGDSAAGDNRGQRDGRQFRPRHPHFRRFRGGQRGQGAGDPAQEDQPDLTGGSAGSGSGS